MYHCNFIINIISKHETIKEELKEVPAPERFHLEYIMDTTPQNDSVKKADLIIWDTEQAPEEILSTLSFIRANKKKGAEIILSITNYVASDFTKEGYAGLEQVWIKPYTTARLQFMFAQYLKQQKERKDAWLTEHYLDALIDGIPDLVWFKDKIGMHMKVKHPSFPPIPPRTGGRPWATPPGY